MWVWGGEVKREGEEMEGGGGGGRKRKGVVRRKKQRSEEVHYLVSVCLLYTMLSNQSEQEYTYVGERKRKHHSIVSGGNCP